MYASPSDVFQIARSILNERVLDAVYRHARRAYPDECCGMILASRRVRPCENAQNRFHHGDPKQFARTAADAFCLALEDELFLAESFDSDDPVQVLYHSHPDAGDASFSAADERGATWNGAPIYPALLHWVVACGSGGVTDARLYGARHGRFVEVVRFPDTRV